MIFYFEKGYPADAVLEYLLNIINSGFEPWRLKNPDLNWRKFTFGVNDITAVTPVFDLVKLADVSKNVIAKMSGEVLYKNWLAWAEEFNPELAKKLKLGKEYFINLPHGFRLHL